MQFGLGIETAGETQASAQRQRRQMTIMFCDMVGSTELATALDPETLRDLIARYQAMVAVTVARFRGFIAHYMGDGVLVYFGYPYAEEADVELAIRAGLAVLSSAASSLADAQHRVRVGIATGLVIVGDIIGEGTSRQHSAVGETVNLAARLQSMTAPDTILVCPSTRRRAGALFRFTELAPARIKGFPEPVTTWRVLGEAASSSRFEALRASIGLTPFVGRQAELDVLEGVVTLAPGRPGAIDICGEPGIGKSRLLHEFCERVRSQGTPVLRAGCTPDGQQTPFLPFIELVHQLFGTAPGDPAADVAGKLTLGLAGFGLGSAQSHAVLMNLLGLSGPDGTLREFDEALIGRYTRDLLLQLLSRRGRSERIFILLEDLHWIDTASEELVDRLIKAGDVANVTIVHTRRPSRTPSWFLQPNVRSMALEPLSDLETARLVQERFGDNTLPAGLSTLIAEKSDGNPLFAEEIVASLLEDVASAPAHSGMPGLVDVASSLPPSLESLLASRVARVTPDDRALLQLLAVVGRSFNVELLRPILVTTPHMQDRLTALVAADLLRPTGNPDVFMFKHALVREVLYRSLLAPTRAHLHGLVAEEIERRSEGRLVEMAEVLAWHFSQTTLATKAITYLHMAGRKSFGVYSLNDAENYLRQALELFDRQSGDSSDEQGGVLVTLYLQLLGLQSRYPLAISVFERYRPLLARLGDDHCTVRALGSVSFAYIMQTRFSEALATSDEAVEIAGRIDQPLPTIYATSCLIYTQSILQTKSLEELEPLALSAIEKARTINDGFIQARLLYDLSFYYLMCGLLDEAREWAGQLLRLGEQRGDARAVGFAQWALGLMCIAQGDYDGALEMGEGALAASLTPWDHVGALWVKTGALTSLLRAEAAETAMHELKALCLASNDQLSLLSSELFFGLITVLKGRMRKGIRHIERCIVELEQRGWSSLADWARMNLAEVYLELLKPTVQPKLSIVLRNLPYILFLRAVAARRAATLLTRALRNKRIQGRGYMHARMTFNLGVANIALRRFRSATTQFGKAQRIIDRLKDRRLAERVSAKQEELILLAGREKARRPSQNRPGRVELLRGWTEDQAQAGLDRGRSLQFAAQVQPVVKGDEENVG